MSARPMTGRAATRSTRGNDGENGDDGGEPAPHEMSRGDVGGGSDCEYADESPREHSVQSPSLENRLQTDGVRHVFYLG